MSSVDLARLKKLLEEQHHWPHEYLFKFIVPQSERQHFLDATAPLQWSEKPSSKGNYIAFSASKLCRDSEEVLHIYRQAVTIKGIITL